MVVRKVRNRVINANLTRSRAALKAAINKSLTAYMNNAASPANLANVNRATRNLIKVYVENVGAANVKPPNENGGNTPPGNGNGGNQIRAIVPVGNVPPVGPNMKAPLANRGANEKPRQPTAVNLTRLRGIATNGPSTNNTILKNQTNFVNALTRNFPNHPNVKAAKNVLNARRAAKNITAGAIAAAKNKAAANAAEAERAAQAAQNAKNAEAAANAEQRAREAAIKAAKNAAEANKAAKNIAASAIASAIEKQKAVNNQAAAAREAAAAANAAKRAAEIKSKWQRAGQGVGKAVQAGNAFSAAGANSRRQKLLNEAKRKEAMNVAHAKLMGRINSASTSGQLNTIVSNIARNGKNFNAQKRMNLQSKVKDKRRQIAIQQKKNDGQGVRAGRSLARATRSNNALASANLGRNSLNAPQIRETVQSLTTNYNEFIKEIRNAHSPAMITRLKERLARNERKTVGKKFTPEQRANLSKLVNNKNRSLKGPGPSSNAPKNGGLNNNMSKLSLSQLNAIIRLTKARLNKGQGANGNKNRLARATKLANALRPKKKGLFGHIGGALGAVGGATKYVAAGTAHHATRGVKAAAGVAAKGAKVAIPLALAGAAYLGQQGARRGFNVTVGKKPSNKIPNTSLNNGKKPGKLERAVQKNENIAKARREYQRSVGGNASENAMSAAGAFGALAVAGGVKAAAGVKRAVNISKAVKAGKFTAKTLRYAAK